MQRRAPSRRGGGSTLPARLWRGAGAGTLATVPMTGVMLAARRIGAMRGQYPPVEITARLAGEEAPAAPSRPTTAVAAAAHLAFGAAAGALFAIALDRPGQADVGRGIAFGLGVWLLSYAGYLPALHLMPGPGHDVPGRPRTMAAAHVVYGAALAGGLHVLEPAVSAPERAA